MTEQLYRQRIRALADGARVLLEAAATDLQSKQISLQKNMCLLQPLQTVYIPGAAVRLSQENVAREEELNVEYQKVWMPSDFPASQRAARCYQGLAEKEEVLQEAECFDGLETI